jgi:hypothetical protein
LLRKLPRMPFPPKTEEAFFDYEANLNRIVSRLYLIMVLKLIWAAHPRSPIDSGRTFDEHLESRD